MNVQILKSAGIDYDRGVKRFVGRAHLYEKALGKFLQDTTFTRIRAAYEAHDMPLLLNGAHELKGMCGNIALTALYETADEIVSMLRGGASAGPALDDAVERLTAQYERVLDAVRAAMEENNA